MIRLLNPMRQSIVRPFDTRLKPQGLTFAKGIVDIQEQSSLLSRQDNYSEGLANCRGISFLSPSVSTKTAKNRGDNPSKAIQEIVKM